jgi:hypothetical protein
MRDAYQAYMEDVYGRQYPPVNSPHLSDQITDVIGSGFGSLGASIGTGLIARGGAAALGLGRSAVPLSRFAAGVQGFGAEGMDAYEALKARRARLNLPEDELSDVGWSLAYALPATAIENVAGTGRILKNLSTPTAAGIRAAEEVAEPLLRRSIFRAGGAQSFTGAMEEMAQDALQQLIVEGRIDNPKSILLSGLAGAVTEGTAGAGFQALNNRYNRQRNEAITEIVERIKQRVAQAASDERIGAEGLAAFNAEEAARIAANTVDAAFGQRATDEAAAARRTQREQDILAAFGGETADDVERRRYEANLANMGVANQQAEQARQQERQSDFLAAMAARQRTAEDRRRLEVIGEGTALPTRQPVVPPGVAGTAMLGPEEQARQLAEQRMAEANQAQRELRERAVRERWDDATYAREQQRLDANRLAILGNQPVPNTPLVAAIGQAAPQAQLEAANQAADLARVAQRQQQMSAALTERDRAALQQREDANRLAVLGQGQALPGAPAVLPPVPPPAPSPTSQLLAAAQGSQTLPGPPAPGQTQSLLEAANAVLTGQPPVIGQSQDDQRARQGLRGAKPQGAKPGRTVPLEGKGKAPSPPGGIFQKGKAALGRAARRLRGEGPGSKKNDIEGGGALLGEIQGGQPSTITDVPTQAPLTEREGLTQQPVRLTNKYILLARELGIPIVVIDNPQSGLKAGIALGQDGKIRMGVSRSWALRAKKAEMESVLEHELIHGAHHLMWVKEWRESGTTAAYTTYASEKARQLADQIPQDLKNRITRSYIPWYNTTLTDLQLVSEYVRQLVQQSRSGLISENYREAMTPTMMDHLRKFVKFLKDVIAGKKDPSPELTELARDVERVIAIAEGKIVKPLRSNRTTYTGPLIYDVDDIDAVYREPQGALLAEPQAPDPSGLGVVTAGANNKRLTKIVRTNQDRGNVAPVTGREMIQNAMDQTRDHRQDGSGQITYASEAGPQYNGKETYKLAVIDNAQGMSPAFLASNYLGLAHSTKGVGKGGGFGIAKGQMFGNAIQFDVYSIWHSPDGKRYFSHLVGNPEGFDDAQDQKDINVQLGLNQLNPNLTLDVRELKPGEEGYDDSTGTAMLINGVGDYYTAKGAVQQTGEFNQDKVSTTRSYYGAQSSDGLLHKAVDVSKPYRPEPLAVSAWNTIETIRTPNVETDVQIDDSHIDHDVQYFNVPVFSNGTFQFNANFQLKDKVDLPKVRINVRPQKLAEDDNYPFPLDRSSLKEPVKGKVGDFINRIGAIGRKKRIDKYRNALVDAPDIVGTSGIKLLDVSEKLPTTLTDQMANDPVVSRMSIALRDVTKTIGKHFNKIFPSQGFSNSEFAGIFSGTADAFGVRFGITGPTGPGQIYLDPFLTYEDALTTANDEGRPDDVMYYFAGKMLGIIVHELNHQITEEEGESMARELTFRMGFFGLKNPPLEKALKQFQTLTNDPAFAQTLQQYNDTIKQAGGRLSRDHALSSFKGSAQTKSGPGTAAPLRSDMERRTTGRAEPAEGEQPAEGEEAAGEEVAVTMAGQKVPMTPQDILELLNMIAGQVPHGTKMTKSIKDRLAKSVAQAFGPKVVRPPRPPVTDIVNPPMGLPRMFFGNNVTLSVEKQLMDIAKAFGIPVIVSDQFDQGAAATVHTGAGRVVILINDDSWKGHTDEYNVATMEEELIHAIHFLIWRDEWIADGRPGSFISFINRRGSELAAEITPLLRQKIQQAYFGRLNTNRTLDNAGLVAEYVRMLVQEARSGKISETSQEGLTQKFLAFLKKFVAQLRRAIANSGGKDAHPQISRLADDIQMVIKLGESRVTSKPGEKADVAVPLVATDDEAMDLVQDRTKKGKKITKREEAVLTQRVDYFPSRGAVQEATAAPGIEASQVQGIENRAATQREMLADSPMAELIQWEADPGATAAEKFAARRLRYLIRLYNAALARLQIQGLPPEEQQNASLAIVNIDARIRKHLDAMRSAFAAEPAGAKKDGYAKTVEMLERITTHPQYTAQVTTAMEQTGTRRADLWNEDLDKGEYNVRLPESIDPATGAVVPGEIINIQTQPLATAEAVTVQKVQRAIDEINNALAAGTVDPLDTATYRWILEKLNFMRNNTALGPQFTIFKSFGPGFWTLMKKYLPFLAGQTPMNVAMESGGRAIQQLDRNGQALDWLVKQTNAVAANKSHGDSAIGIALRAALDAHGLDATPDGIVEYNRTVYNELVHSHQEFEYPHLVIGRKTQEGGEIMKEDIDLMNTQYEHVQAVRAISEQDLKRYGANSEVEDIVGKDQIRRSSVRRGPKTMPRQYDPNFHLIASQWHKYGDAEKIAWLLDPSQFPTFRGHILERSRNYTKKTPYATAYNTLASQVATGTSPTLTTMDQLMQELSLVMGAPNTPLFKQTIIDDVIPELLNKFNRQVAIWTGERKPAMKAQPFSRTLIQSLRTTGSFLNPRKEQILPALWYRYGMLTKDQLAGFRGNARNIAEVRLMEGLEFMLGSFEQLRKDLMFELTNKYGTQALKRGQADTVAMKRAGQIRYTINELDNAIRGIKIHLDDHLAAYNRGLMDTNKALDDIAVSANSLLALSLLSSTSSGISNLLSGIGVNDIIVANQIGTMPDQFKSFFGSGKKLITNGLYGAINRMAAAPGPIGAAARSMKGKLNAMAPSLGAAMADKQALYDRLKQMGSISVYDTRQGEVRKALGSQGATMDPNRHWLTGFQNRVMGSAPVRALQRTMPRWGDQWVNMAQAESFYEIIENLSSYADNIASTRPAVLDPGNPAQRISHQELGVDETGMQYYRDIFNVMGGVDAVMFRYIDRIRAARAAGTPVAAVPFLTPEEEEMYIQRMGLLGNVLGPYNTPTGFRTSVGKSIFTTFGSYTSNLGHQLSRIGRVAHGADDDELKRRAAKAGISLALLLAMSVFVFSAKNIGREFITGQQPAQMQLGNVLNDPTSTDTLRYLATALGTSIPYISNPIDSLMGGGSSRNVMDVAQFVPMAGFAKSLYDAGNRAFIGGDYVGAAGEVMGRWAPWTAPATRFIPPFSEQLDLRNALRAGRAAAPTEFELRRPGGGGTRPSPLGLELRQLETAAYGGDEQGVINAYESAITKQMEISKVDRKEAERRVRSAVKARTVENRLFARKLTDQQWQQFLGRATGGQEAALNRAFEAEKLLQSALKLGGGQTPAGRRLRSQSPAPIGGKKGRRTKERTLRAASYRSPRLTSPRKGRELRLPEFPTPVF